MIHPIEVVVVSETEVATDLGFVSIHEMRRWETEMGQKVADLEAKLRVATDERDRFLQAGLRSNLVLERVKAWNAAVNRREGEIRLPSWPDILLAIDVVLGKAVDWENRLDGWWTK